MKNVNTDFLLDIWADLKAKRLAPVAVGLAVALVAMPALMLKGEDAPSASPLPIVAAPASADDAEVEVADELAERGSKLDSYKAHDPFSGVVQGNGGDSDKSGAAIAPTDGAPADTGGDLAMIFGGGGSPTSGPPDSVPGLGPPDSGGGLTTGGDTPSPRVRRTNYTYELDVKFGQTGREKRYRHLSRMSVLPNPKAPALMFMGVPVDAKTAIFFVHPKLSHAGEGVCMPSPTDCTFLELKLGRDHFLSVDDYEFHLHLYGINKVKVDDAATGPRKTTGTNRAGRNAGDGALGEAGGHDLPALVDGIG